MTPAPLILVVGPSGAGKDSLMEGARQRLSGEPGFHFARRIITRPASPETEDYHSVTPEEFANIEAAGGFLLAWSAHGLAYGIPAEVNSHRRHGTAVVVNTSRTVVDEARATLAPVGVIVVTAPADLLAFRLALRGRESADDIRRRLDRAPAPLPAGPRVCEVINDSTLDVGIDRFVAALRSLSPAKPVMCPG